MIEVGILHLPRPDRVPQLQRTVETLVAAGAATITIYRDNVGDGATRNMISAWRDLSGSRWDYVAVVDDDLVFAARALELAYGAIEGSRYWPDDWGKMPAISMWTIEQNVPHELRMESGWVTVMPSLHIWGGCVVIKTNHAQALSETMQKILDDSPVLETKPDACLFLAMEKMKARVMFHLPSLCDHIGGEHSTLGNDHSKGDTRGFRFNEW